MGRRRLSRAPDDVFIFFKRRYGGRTYLAGGLDSHGALWRTEFAITREMLAREIDGILKALRSFLNKLVVPTFDGPCRGNCTLFTCPR